LTAANFELEKKIKELQATKASKEADETNKQASLDQANTAINYNNVYVAKEQGYFRSDQNTLIERSKIKAR